jgi:enoyl-[acyl-carrier protein] reductase I
VYSIDLSGKTGLITGVANKRSLAWAVARCLHQAGARLAFTSRRILDEERAKPKLEALISELEGSLLLPCDVRSDDHIANVYETLEHEFGRLDYLVHSVAFAPLDEMQGLFVQTSREGFQKALEVSAYSLIALTRGALPLMEKAGGGSILAMSYLAAERAIPTYNVMGTAKAALEQIIRQLALELGPRNIRVNGVSCGPVQTLAARGVPGFTNILNVYEKRAPLRRNVTHDEVGKASLFLVSDLSSGITGEVLYVDGGFHITAF